MTLKKIFFCLQILLLGLFVVSCDEDDNSPLVNNPEENQGANIKALVLNEGLMNTNSGCISVLYDDGTVEPDIFKKVNNRPMGDVAQSITKINGNYFVALNNSKKIEVIDPTTFKSVSTIEYSEMGLPRQIIAISDTTAVVSDLNTQLVVIRTVPPYGKPLNYIKIPTWIEYMEKVDNKLFGMTPKGLYVLDANDLDVSKGRFIEEVHNDEVTKTCKLLKDKNNMLWALMNTKNESNKISGVTLSCINPTTEKVEKRYTLPIVLSGDFNAGDVVGIISYNRTDIDRTGTWIYFSVKTLIRKKGSYMVTQQSVYKMNVDNGEFELYRDLPGINMMYGCAVSPDGEVWLCDCLDYSAQRGYVRNYKADESIESYRVGVYPSQMYFPE